MSNGSNTGLARALQVAEGTRAGSSETWYPIRYNGGAPTRSITSEDDPEIGGASSSIVSEGAAGGTLGGSVWFGELDWAIESVLRGTFSSDVIDESESTDRFWTLEESQPDLAAGNKFTSFIDTIVTGLNISLLSPNQRITSEVVLSSVNGLSGAVAVRGATALQTKNSASPMRTGASVTNVQIDDADVSSLNIRIRQLDLSLTRVNEDEPQVDVAGRGGLSVGDLEVSITMNVYDDQRTTFDSLFSGTTRKIEFDIADPGGANDGKYAIVIDGATPSAGELSDPERNTTRFQTWTFTANNVQITRSSV